MHVTTDLGDRRTAQPSLPAVHLLRWCAMGWTLFGRAPLRLWLLSLMPVAVEAAVQLLPHAGIVLSKLLTPLASAWALLLVDRFATGGAFVPGAAGAILLRRARPLLLLAVVSAAIFALQCGVALALGGPGQAWALLSGDAAGMRLSKPAFALVLVSGIPAAMLLMFAMPRVLLDGRTAIGGLRDSVAMARWQWRPMLAFGAACATLLGGLLWAPWLLLAMLPFSMCVGYAGYVDLFRGRVAS